MADIKVVVINESTVLKDEEVQAAIPALQKQVHRDFAPVWGIDADITRQKVHSLLQALGSLQYLIIQINQVLLAITM